MDSSKNVLKFIAQFTGNGTKTEVIDTFTSGCCYWFANILASRFGRHDSSKPIVEIMYDPVANHFGCMVDYVIYDITGDVTNKYCWVLWSKMPYYDELQYNRIIRDCVNF